MTLPAWLRLNNILGRSVLMLFGLLVVSQVLNIAVLGFFVISPQLQRVSELVARNLMAIKTIMDDLPPDKQNAFVARLSDNSAIRFHRDGEPPATRSFLPNILEIAFMRAMEAKLREDPRFSWQRDGDGRLWVSTTLAGQRYWITANPPAALRPDIALATGAITVLMIALTAGIAAQGWIAQPLTQLTRAAANLSLTSKPQALPEGGFGEIGALTASFNRMTARLAAAESDRELMLAGVSHDLRTPLAKIRLAAEMIGASDQDLKTTISDQVERMDVMLSQFLDYSRGADLEEPVRTDLAALAGGVIFAHGDARFAFKSAGPVLAIVRAEGLRRALTNLMVNALKYGQAPFAVEVSSDQGTATLSVIDHGQGIAVADRARLLQPFARGDAARGGQPGSGLGLSIAARVCAAHGGALTFATLADGGFAVQMQVPIRS